MKKLFISCPMKGRTEENIKKSMEKMHKMAEIIFDEELEVIPTYIEEEPPEGTANRGVWYLGKSIELLAKADFFIGVGYSDFFKGCEFEYIVARSYGIRMVNVEMCDLMPDAIQIIQDSWGNEKTVTPRVNG